MRCVLLCPALKIIVLEPDLRLSFTGTLMTTLPPPEVGWSSQTWDPPLTLRDSQMTAMGWDTRHDGSHLTVVFLQLESPFAK